MAQVSLIPFPQVAPELQEIMRTYDKEYAGSEFVRAFAHAPEVFKSFASYYFPLIFETRGSLDMRLTEMVRLKVAEKNDCAL
ncbi:MAG TPA: hypothetical protein VKS22_13825 [Candidatus Binataceae bacterium]|nr:hypothetical protein [Candidatus Binataceae bacterium]